MALKVGSNLDLSKVVKSLGQKHKLVPHLEMAIGKEEFEWNFEHKPKEHDDAWHPSGDCTPSLHDLYLKATGELPERAINASLYKAFMVGHFWHQYLQWIVEHVLEFAPHEAIERQGIKRWGDDPVPKQNPDPEPGYIPSGKGVRIHPKPYHWATGSGDIAPCSIPGSGDYLIDFKTMNARDFSKISIPEYYGDKWECQGNIYMDFFDIDRILFVGICKDSPHDMKEWEFVRNQPLIDAIYLKWRIVGECMEEAIEPPDNEEIMLPLKGPVVT